MKTRFCPSPTGNMHLGNARTALFNTLLALNANGTFLLRIEDTDNARSTMEHTHTLLEDLYWLGCVGEDWQEGPRAYEDVNGQFICDDENGPMALYWQSKRGAIYKQYYDALESIGAVYPCFCSDYQLAIARKTQLAAGKPPRYSGTCSMLSPNEIAEKRKQGLAPTLRFRVPLNQIVEFEDLIRGKQSFDSGTIGDFIIRRADGSSSFMFCNAIDDAVMGVTHALRGEDHLTNTPRQLLILRALKLPEPQYGHISLIVGSDGSPLSKRHGSRSIKELHEEGFLPQAIVNYLARLGHTYANLDEPTHQGLMSLKELALGFSTNTMSTSPARFDGPQLFYWQKEAINLASLSELKQWLAPKIDAIVPTAKLELFIETIRSNIVFPKDAAHWAKIFFLSSIITFHEKAIHTLQQAGTIYFDVGIKIIDDFHKDDELDYQRFIKLLQNQLNIKGKGLYQPLRTALTGELHGPELDKIFKIMGKTDVLYRLKQAREIASQLAS
jgi:glutamyl-tRNA synthetase